MSDAAGFYQTEGPGMVLIFNQENYPESSGHSSRPGSSKDAEDIKEVFHERNFEVKTFNDLSVEDIRADLKSVGGFIHLYRCLVVFVLAHGYQGGIYGIKGGELSIQEIQSCLCAENCPAFKDDPKIIIFQSCRLKKGHNEFAISDEEHFLLAFSTGLESEAYRDIKSGSFYIQALLEAIRDSGDDKDLVSLLTVVRRKMLQHPEGQKPVYNTSLTDDVYAKRPHPLSGSIEIPHVPAATSISGVMETSSSQEQSYKVVGITRSLPNQQKVVSGIHNKTSKYYKRIAATRTPRLSRHSQQLPLQDIKNSGCPISKQSTPEDSKSEIQQGEDIFQFHFPLEAHSECSTPSSTSTGTPNEEANSIRHPLQPENEKENNADEVPSREEIIEDEQTRNENEQIKEQISNRADEKDIEESGIKQGGHVNEEVTVEEEKETIREETKGGPFNEEITVEVERETIREEAKGGPVNDEEITVEVERETTIEEQTSLNSKIKLFSHMVKKYTQTPIDNEFIDIGYELIGVHSQSTIIKKEEWQEIFMPPLEDNGYP